MLLVQRRGHIERNQIGLHLFERAGVVQQGLVEISIVTGAIDAEVMAHFMPECAVKIAVRRQVLRLLLADGGGETMVGALKNIWVPHVVCERQTKGAMTGGR